MTLSETPEYTVERAVLRDLADNECGAFLFDDERGAAVRAANGFVKCAFKDARDFFPYADKYGLYGDVCIMGVDRNAAEVLGINAAPCRTFAYLGELPPAPELPNGVVVKRLAHTLAGTVFEAYHNPDGGYTEKDIEELMRTKGVFGAISGGRLAGFIGRHGDGSMGLLEVFEPFKRKGIGSALERFMINYVMTFGRTPFCDVFADNAASLELQQKSGLTAAHGYTLWGKIERKQDGAHSLI